MRRKTVIFLGDGMADEPVEGLGGSTPLEHAATPAMDAIARDGVSGSLLTLPPGYPTSSEVANMSILGCDLTAEFCGRGPLEALGLGIPMSPSDIAYRVNFTTVTGGILRDFSGGRIAQANAVELIGVLNEKFGSADIKFFPGVSYRTIMLLSGPGYSELVNAEKPDDNQGEYVTDHLPTAGAPEAGRTAELMRRLMLESSNILEETSVNRALRRANRPMANSLWPWSGGKAGHIKTVKEKYDISGAVISAVAVIKGLGKSLGMDVIEVDGATGYVGTNYEGKAEAAIKALDDHDFVYLHLAAIDEVSHQKDLRKKLQAIEDFDSRVIAPVLQHFGSEINVAVLPDHPVPVSTGKHTRTPVPVAIRMDGMDSDAVTSFGESACPAGCLGNMTGSDLMTKLFS